MYISIHIFVIFSPHLVGPQKTEHHSHQTLEEDAHLVWRGANLAETSSRWDYVYFSVGFILQVSV